MHLTKLISLWFNSIGICFQSKWNACYQRSLRWFNGQSQWSALEVSSVREMFSKMLVFSDQPKMNSKMISKFHVRVILFHFSSGCSLCAVVFYGASSTRRLKMIVELAKWIVILRGWEYHRQNPTFPKKTCSKVESDGWTFSFTMDFNVSKYEKPPATFSEETNAESSALASPITQTW